MQELISFIIVIGVIIFIHESGHFTMAKLFGIPVATFSLGFGPRLFGFRYRETEYKVSAIPLGGYVKIHGMEDQEAAPDDPNSFYNKPRWQRFLVLFMGVGFNIILAILLITIALNRGLQVSQSSGMPSYIGAVDPGSPAEKAGLQRGDKIVSINGRRTPTWEKVYYMTLLNPNQTVTVELERNGEILEKQVHLLNRGVNNLGWMGVAPATDVVVLHVNNGSPAEKAGLKVGDVVKKINGVEIHGSQSAPVAVQKSQGKPIELVVQHKNGRQETLTVQPQKGNDGRWVIGFIPGEPTKLKQLAIGAALKESLRTCIEHVQLNGLYIYKLIRGDLSLKAASGPFQIADLSQAARETGFSTFLLFIGTVSFDIGIINLLPIPALDGGHIFFLILEGIFRREFSVKLKERLTMIGFLFLICVMVVVLYYDILKTGPVQKLIESFTTR